MKLRSLIIRFTFGGLLCFSFGCDVDAEKKPRTTQIKAIQLQVSGRVVSAGRLLSNVPWVVTRSRLEAESGEDSEILSGESDEAGKLSFLLENMDVEVYRYALRVKSPDPALYQDADAVLLYSRRDDETDLGDI
ncbi:MAG: hypothetical protein VYD19_00310, partial [Myxococcota bacterium]|nr:hypothetical protein [Myxococcota bacterium]